MRKARPTANEAARGAGNNKKGRELWKCRGDPSNPSISWNSPPAARRGSRGECDCTDFVPGSAAGRANPDEAQPGNLSEKLLGWMLPAFGRGSSCGRTIVPI